MRVRATILARVTAVLAAVLALVSVPATSRAAQEPPAEGTGTGYKVTVTVTFSGDGAPASGGGSYKVHPTCWWEPAPGDYTNAAHMFDWYLEVTAGGSATAGNDGTYGPLSVWRDAVTKEANGEDLSWWHAHCENPADYPKFNLSSAEGYGGILGGGVDWLTYLYRTFPAGVVPQTTLIDPAELARIAREAMVIPDPEFNRNPKIGAAGGATLVRLPTWFWVLNNDSVGGPDADGRRVITASVGPVSATVTATTNFLELSSPAGSADCPPRTATVHWGAAGASDAAACTVQFARASVGGPYQVTALTRWNATWQGVDADGVAAGGDLVPLERRWTTTVPVAEVQNVVTR